MNFLSFPFRSSIPPTGNLLICTLFVSLLFSRNCLSQSDSLSPYAQKVISTAKDVETKNKLVGKLDPNAMASLPIGIVKEIGVTKYIIAIDSGVFRPNGAFFSAYMAIELPGSATPLAFATKNLSFNPKGVVAGPLTRLMLVSEHRIKIGPDITLHLKPDGTNYVEWDCNGFRSVSLKGYFEFAPGMLLPDTSQTHEKFVTAGFQLITNDIHNFVADVSISPFCINGLKDFSFTVKDAAVDLSEIANIPGILFPKGYPNTGGINPVMWTGFYIRELKVKLPPELSKGGKRIEISANTFLIDKTGVSGNIGISNLFSLSEGSMSGWPFSVDQLSVNFISNRINGSSIAGQVQLPVMDSVSTLKYTAGMYQNVISKEVDYTFLIQPKNNVRFPAFAANVNIYNTSSFSTFKTRGRFIPTAVLNGDITVSHTSLKSPTLKFEKLILTTEKPYIKGGAFGLSGTTVASVGGFGCSIDSIRILLNNQQPELDVTATINFMDKTDFGFSASTTARVIAKMNNPVPVTNAENTGPPQKISWSFDRVAINEIGLDIQTQPYRLKGGIAYKENDPVYGRGFFGGLLFELRARPAPFNISVNAGFGSTPTLRYWYADGIVSSTIPLGSIAEIKRLMGGMYYHMKPTTGFSSLAGALSKNTKNAPTPVNYAPDANAGYGFRAGVTFSSVKSEKVFNGDVLLTVNINNNGGLSNVALDGNVVSLSTISERQSKPVGDQKIYGSMHMEYDDANQSFHAIMQANINVPGMISGSGLALIHFEPNVWYVCIGRPSNSLNVRILDFAAVRAYFMMGHNLEPMPPPPPLVTGIVNNYGIGSTRNINSLQSANGLALGVNFTTGLSGRFGNDNINVNYLLYAVVGFDVMATDYGTKAKCSNTNSELGINGWYSQGQAYLGLQGNLRVHAELNIGNWDPSMDVDILSFSAAALLQAQAPKPTHFNGAVGIQVSALGLELGPYSIPFSYGTQCGTVIN